MLGVYTPASGSGRRCLPDRRLLSRLTARRRVHGLHAHLNRREWSPLPLMCALILNLSRLKFVARRSYHPVVSRDDAPLDVPWSLGPWSSYHHHSPPSA
ncbi:hypothetical protein CVT26_008759 [Gymnopilus dilepis]|uniref:Uncharacterized protein n=1 Tax=Gymnopilus dilepis TaxID=231916 RepID=A0A409YRD1_9AGAR|nr:hypothetical protein CVT26_008759 [Gymnopilus dilepis]